jgi:glycosyltransferase involved in cell wall biosynthesis
VVTVLHLCAGNLYGGIERIVVECATDRHLAPAMQPRFATCFDGRLSSELDAAGTPCARLGDVRVSRPHTVVRARRRLTELLGSARADAAICHSPWTFGLAAPVLHRAGVPAILWIHDSVSGRPWSERWASLTRPHAIIANSRFTAASVSALYQDMPFTVLYAPVAPPARIDALERGRLRTSLGVERDSTCVVLLASRLERWKGHAELLAAIADLSSDWAVWIAGAPQKAGEAEYERELREFCAAHGLSDRVQFLGNRLDVAAVMQAADIHCQPNTAPEPFGLAFIEALYASLPVITTEMGGATEIVTRQCGVLVPPRDRAALRAAVDALVRNADARRTLGAAGPARAAVLCDPATQLPHLSAVVKAVAA